MSKTVATCTSRRLLQLSGAGLLVLVLVAALVSARATATSAPAPAGAAPPRLAGFIQPRPVSARPRRAALAAGAAAGASIESPEALLFQRWFQGRFDNAGQVAEERAQGMGPGEGGGHEQIHCVLEPLPALRPGSLGGGERFVGATYYFDDKPEAVFRCRVYSFHPPPAPEEAALWPSELLPHRPFAEMRLHRFTPEYEAGLRKGGYDLQRLLRQEDVDGGGAIEDLDGCSILWGVGEEGGGGLVSFRGVMRHGFCEVGSQREAGVRLRIEDDLVLTETELSVNDRGFDCATGRLVYGNTRGLPYRMARRAW